MSFNLAFERPRASIRIRSKSIPRTSSHQLKQHTYAKEPTLSDSDENTSPQAASEGSINSANPYPKIVDVDASVLQLLAGLQPPSITPWQDAGPHQDWVPKWWHDEQNQAFKAAAIDKKSLNEWDYLEAPWLDRLNCKMSPRKRFTIPQLQILEVQWSNDISPPKVDRQRLAMWMGTRTKHVNIWFQNRRQYEKKVHASGEIPEPAYTVVEGLVEPTAAMKVIVNKIAIGELKADNLTIEATNFNSSNKRYAFRPSVKMGNIRSTNVLSSISNYGELQTSMQGNRESTHVSLTLKRKSSFTQDQDQQSNSPQEEVKMPKNIHARQHTDPGQKVRLSNTRALTDVQERLRTDNKSSTQVHHYAPQQRRSAPINRILSAYKSDWSGESSSSFSATGDEGNVVTTTDLASMKGKIHPSTYGSGRHEPRPVYPLREYKQADWEVQEVLMAADILMGMQGTR
ncbi:hypothetical protein LQV05_001361 [Cryptococcus neoformans]|nr:hypothetical protein C356_02223 [Cryptococcus neoformans var. grubii c45]OXB37982.1 hypothetical protein J007_02208 [Cryptococcus neoformans var. grubii]OXC62297.1 hypothetical protein C358_02277 [Cryptococcus neoformans var. grubii MW-RSA852]UOH84554.1 hypothetical protein LQV05_001361 [Cryptococcus neoformans]